MKGLKSGKWAIGKKAGLVELKVESREWSCPPLADGGEDGLCGRNGRDGLMGGVGGSFQFSVVCRCVGILLSLFSLGWVQRQVGWVFFIVGGWVPVLVKEKMASLRLAGLTGPRLNSVSLKEIWGPGCLAGRWRGVPVTRGRWWLLTWGLSWMSGAETSR